MDSPGCGRMWVFVKLRTLLCVYAAGQGREDPDSDGRRLCCERAVGACGDTFQARASGDKKEKGMGAPKGDLSAGYENPIETAPTSTTVILSEGG